MTNPPSAAPDEANHYLRAVGISDGSLVGRRVRDTNPTLDTKQLVWTNQATRSGVIPPGLAPGGFACELSSETKSAACTLTAATNREAIHANTEVGTYQPLPYLLPAAVLGADHHVSGSLRLARLTMVAVWVAALAVTMWALWDEQLGLASLTGLVVAVTPMVVFVGTSVNGSSLEIIGSIAFFASLLRLIRPSSGRPPPTQTWLFAGASGLMLALSRSPGPIWVVLDMTIVVLHAGFKPARSTSRAGGRPAVLAATAVLVGIALNCLWEAAYGPHVTITWLPKLESLQAGRREVQQSLQDLVGRFGYLNVPLPNVVLIAWALLALILAWFGVRAADRRGRIALAVAVAISCLGPIYLFAAVIRNTGFGLQGRDYLPIVALLPLLAFRADPPQSTTATGRGAIVRDRGARGRRNAVHRVVAQLATLRCLLERTVVVPPTRSVESARWLGSVGSHRADRIIDACGVWLEFFDWHQQRQVSRSSWRRDYFLRANVLVTTIGSCLDSAPDFANATR